MLESIICLLVEDQSIQRSDLKRDIGHSYHIDNHKGAVTAIDRFRLNYAKNALVDQFFIYKLSIEPLSKKRVVPLKEQLFHKSAENIIY